MRRLWLPAVVALSLAGCATAPVREAPPVGIDIPAAWTVDSVAGEASVSHNWWREFGDDALDGFIEEALAYNTSIRSALARVEQAAALARVTRADALPNVSGSFNASRRQQNLIGIAIPGAPRIITSRSNAFGVSLDTSWEVDLWGRVRSAHSAALAEFEASRADLAGVRLSIAAQTAKSWFALVEAREQARLAEETVSSYEASARRVRARYESGVRTSLDLRLALSSLASARSLLVVRLQQLDVATRQLEILLGRYPAGDVAQRGDLPSVTVGVPAAMPSELLIRRPDLFAAERRFAAAEARASQARRAFFPRITLTGSAGTLSDQLEDLSDGDFSVWSVAAGLVQPIFQGGRLLANLSQSNAASDMALAEYATTLLGAFGEVETALFAEGALSERARHLAEATAQSEAARELAERQYASGLVDYITVLETQRRALTARSELIAVRRARLDARVNLYAALGGGFELDDQWMEFLAPLPDTKTDGGSQ